MKNEEASFSEELQQELGEGKKQSKNILSEFFYQHQKLKIKDIKREDPSNNPNSNIKKLKENLMMLTLSDKNLWDYSAFDTDNIEGEDVPYVGSSWLIYPFLEKYSAAKGVEIRNIALRSGIGYNYQLYGLEVNVNFSLRGEASMWLMTRCSDKSDKSKDSLTPHSAMIKISKEDKSQRCFVTLSVFVEDESKNNVFKTFMKRQLVNTSKSKSNYHYENDVTDFRLYVVDVGDEKIKLKILLNEGKDENMITGNFFLPSTDTSSIIISGSGQSSIVKSLVCKPFLKMEGITFTSEQRNCDCCLIY